MKQIRSVPKKYIAAQFTAWVTQAVGYIVTVAGPIIAQGQLMSIAIEVEHNTRAMVKAIRGTRG